MDTSSIVCWGWKPMGGPSYKGALTRVDGSQPWVCLDDCLIFPYFSLAQDGFGRSPLHEAVEFGHKKVVEEILAWQGSNQLVSAPDELGWTALHWAALKGSEDIARRLLDAKAKVDAKENEFGCEPLQWAARRGHLQLIRLLLKHGAVASHQDRENRTAAKWAHLTNHLSAFALLEGMELRSEGSEDEEALDETYNMSRLHAAVAKNNISEMKRLLRSSEAKDLLVKVDKWGRTPLVTALQASHKATGPGSEKLVMHFIRLMKMLRLEGTKGVFRPDKDRRDPVHWAALAGHRQVVLELSHMIPSDTPASDRWGNRLFHHAAANGHTSMMEWLLDQRAIVDGISSSKQTPLHMAAAGGHLDVTKLLLRRGSPLNAQDRFLSLISMWDPSSYLDVHLGAKVLTSHVAMRSSPIGFASSEPISNCHLLIHSCHKLS